MKKKLLVLACLSIFSLFFSFPVAADTTTISSYAVSPIFSEHQSQAVDNFFDINWSPKAVDYFSLSITNNTAKEQTYVIQVNKARTNKNGIIDYSDTTPEAKKVQYKLTQMIKLPETVTVPANSSQKINGELAFPENDFNGILMAGIHVSEKKKKDAQATISNTIAYNIPFVVRGNQDERPTPKLTMNKLTVEKFSSDTYAINANVTNQGPNLLKEVQFKAEVKDKNGKIVVSQKNKIDITPATSFIFPVKLPENLQSGKYTLTLNVNHRDKNKWLFKKSFEISKKDSKKISSVSNGKNSHFVRDGLLSVSAILLIGGAVLFFLQKKSN